MGLEKDPPKKGKSLPPVFSGEAILVQFPDEEFRDQQGRRIVNKVETITYPDFVHYVYLNDKIEKVLGSDLEIGMAFLFNGEYIPIKFIDKKYTYHGMMLQTIQIGVPCDPTEIGRHKWIKRIKDDGFQTWEEEKETK